MDAFGKYEVVEKIGSGGFGAVFKAWDASLKRHVAVKICTADDDELRQRFYREAEIAASLHHQNITTVFDFGTEAETPYLVQEFLGGEDLDRLIARREEMPLERQLGCLLQVAEGLAHAHSKGIVHRDVKPANIRVLGDGTAKIMDFGIARTLNQETSLTREGVTVGTVAYLAPEQVHGDEVDQRTDIFSFGVLAYELLTGERPFAGDSVSAQLYSIVSRDPAPMRQRWPDCPEEAERLVGRCLRKEPDDRYGSSAELVEALRSLLDHTAAMATLRAPAGEESKADLPLTGTPAAGGDSAIGEVEIGAGRGRAAQPGAAADGRARRAWLPAAVVLAALSAAAVGGWWWWSGQEPGRTAAAAGGTATEAPAPGGGDGPPADGAGGSTAAGSGSGAGEVAPPGDAGPAAGAAESGPGAGEPVDRAADAGTDPELEADTAPGAGAGSEAGRVPAGEAASPQAGGDGEPSAPAPPRPAPARVVIPAAWSGDVLVAIDDGPLRPLLRELELELAPGPHRLRFELNTVDYSASSTVSFDLEPGAERRIEPPIRPPGVLTVQSHLGAPQGRLRIDGEDVGSSPLERRHLAPGGYRLEILPARGEGHPPIVREIAIASGSELIVTFDLTGRRPLRTLEKETALP